MKRCYKEKEVKLRIEQIPEVDLVNDEDDISYWETFANPTIRGSAWVGLHLATFQQLSGIASITFYSS